MPNRRCDKCEFFEKSGDECRKDTPKTIVISDGIGCIQVECGWPTTKPDEWCGEFKEREEKRHDIR